jgi:hypothetical protein
VAWTAGVEGIVGSLRRESDNGYVLYEYSIPEGIEMSMERG